MVRGWMMADAGEDSRALFGAAVRAALEAWPALQVSGAAAGIKIRDRERTGVGLASRLRLGWAT